MADVRRWPRVRQAGVECSVEGCEGDSVSNNLCSKHNMARYRATEKGRAYVREYNKRYKRPDIDKICELCGIGFITAKESQKFCSKCSGGGEAVYLNYKKYRDANRKKVRARDIVNKRIQRGVSLFKKICCFCGEGAEMHHSDYDKPLDVMWACRKHHRIMDSFSWNK